MSDGEEYTILKRDPRRVHIERFQYQGRPLLLELLSLACERSRALAPDGSEIPLDSVFLLRSKDSKASWVRFSSLLEASQSQFEMNCNEVHLAIQL